MLSKQHNGFEETGAKPALVEGVSNSARKRKETLNFRKKPDAGSALHVCHMCWVLQHRGACERQASCMKRRAARN
eukprot:6664597-Pyramimonas_sp.AAC.1